MGKYKYFIHGFSNSVTVRVKPKKTHPNAHFLLDDPSTPLPLNYHPLNGVNVLDMVRINQHILGMTALPAPYNWIAADANNSGSITTWDIAYVRRVILGLDFDYPAGTWRFVPEYLFNNSGFEGSFFNNPFTASYQGGGYSAYMDEVTLDMDDDTSAEEDSWSFHGIKVGDVNCNAQIIQSSLSDEDDDKFTVIFPSSNCVDQNEDILLSFQASSAEDILAYQLGIKFDNESLQYLGTSSGNLTDFSYVNFASKQDEIRTVWYKTDGQPEDISSAKTLFSLRFKALTGFCNLSDVLELSDDVLNNVFYGTSGEPAQTDITLSYQIASSAGYLLSASPNPTTASVGFNFHLNQTAGVEIKLSDYLGNQLVHTAQYSEGNHSYAFNDLTGLSGRVINYVVTLGNTIYSGLLIKSQK